MLSEIVSEIRYRLRALFRRSALERELNDELQFHLQREPGQAGARWRAA